MPVHHKPIRAALRSQELQREHPSASRVGVVFEQSECDAPRHRAASVLQSCTRLIGIAHACGDRLRVGVACGHQESRWTLSQLVQPSHTYVWSRASYQPRPGIVPSMHELSNGVDISGPLRAALSIRGFSSTHSVAVSCLVWLDLVAGRPWYRTLVAAS